MNFAYDNCSVITTNQVPMGTIVTEAYYRNSRRHNVLHTKIYKLHPGMMESGVVILHDDVNPHIGGPVIKIFEKYGWE